MSLSLKDLCYYLNFDELTWNKNKDMLGYITGEKYEDFFYRKHGFKHGDQYKESITITATTDYRITLLENDNKMFMKHIKTLTLKIENMQIELSKKVKCYKYVDVISLV